MSTLAQKTESAGAASAVATERLRFATPAVDIHSEGEGYRLEVEMPGVAKTGVELTVEEGQLTITGHRADTVESGKIVHRERAGTNFRRVFDLDPGIDPQKISAKLDQGLLVVHLPKKESLKPRKVKIS